MARIGDDLYLGVDALALPPEELTEGTAGVLSATIQHAIGGVNNAFL